MESQERWGRPTPASGHGTRRGRARARRSAVGSALVGLAVAFPCAGQTAGAPVAPPPDTAKGLRLDGLAGAEVGPRPPPGWEVRAVSGEREPFVFVSADDGGSPVLHMVADSAAGQVWLELDEGLEPGAGRFSWTWRVEDRPTDVDLRDPTRDDAPARFFVVFGGAGMFDRARFVFYSWGEDEAPDDAFLSHVGDRVGVVVVRGRDDPLGRWLTEVRDPAADYLRLFGEAPTDPIRAVGLMADTDQTGGRAEVKLRSVQWIER